ncbi:uncharacterized protein M421DRAFT_50450 [Didymella exigua CBS 183.55]|uniref:N(6)-L-threonylcarbamoyladenine synthase n=1 Tax=Didymella exigua CBS 183.55 TaxID=1150837 RepID=A0A6A5S3S1_9PLEO|nr:uncharacterized protein M421DRAFT_50450 [Didymella exigua CBS 183.55]KAF1934084.1 hypothetical protein M421DRAFT_50450 [Didymella exigua CBS 183.55]
MLLRRSPATRPRWRPLWRPLSDPPSNPLSDPPSVPPSDPPGRARRRLMTLAIETSCDDTSVAIVEKGVRDGRTVARLHFHKTVTSNNHAFQGVHPLLALKSHQENLAALVADAIAHLPDHGGARRLPDVVAATRGPGMRSSLMCGLDTAKGLAVAWQQKPLVGVHHMQAHALTPRLVAALDAYAAPLDDGPGALAPAFPVLSVLASGGHTMLLASASLTAHTLLGSTADVAVGECLDKAARAILPAEAMRGAKSTMYGALLEAFAFPAAPPEAFASPAAPPEAFAFPAAPPEAFALPAAPAGLTAAQYLHAHGAAHGWYAPPANNEAAIARSRTRWGWSIAPPLLTTGGGAKINGLAMSFSGLTTAVERLVRFPTDPETGKLGSRERSADEFPVEERRDMALAVQRAAFEHIASRVVRGLAVMAGKEQPAPAVVMAGGVASNAFLRHLLAATLVHHGHGHVPLFFPPPEYCTDNAAMIAWTAMDMFDAGYRDTLGIRAVRKWPLDQLLNPQYHDKI